MPLLKVLQGVRPGAVVPYDASLGLSVNAPVLGPLRLPLRTQGELPVPTPPQVELTGIHWDELSLEQAGGVVRLRLSNLNQFRTELSRLGYSLSLAGAPVAEAAITRAVDLPADGGAEELEIPLHFSPRQLGLAVFRVLVGSEADYRFAGQADLDTPFGAMSLPVEKAGRVSLFK